MFKLSKGAEYAIRGLLHLSMQDPGKVSYVEEVAEAQDVPRAYLAKIFQALTKKGLLRSTRGQGGGFTLLRDPAELSVLEVIEAMEGPVHLNECLIHIGFCERDKICPMHELWAEAQSKLFKVLKGTTFAILSSAAIEKEKKVG